MLPDVELFAVQLPGRGARYSEPLIRTLEALVQQLATAIGPYLNIPYAFFGHSMGALVAFELACELQRRGYYGLRHLLLSAKRAPQLAPLGAPIGGLPDEDFLRAVSSYGGIPGEVLQDRDLLAVTLPILRADFQISESYRFQPSGPVDSSATLFGSVRDEYVPEQDLLAWHSNVAGPCAYRRFPEGHFFINSYPSQVVEAVNDTLRELLRAMGPVR